VKFPNGEVATAGINIRPYVMECLRRAASMFQVVVFTASHASYADVVLDILDPNNEIFEMRLYRDSCVRTNDGVYVKDLRIFEHCRRMEDIVIVDNAVYSFGFQLENGIPIIPFYEDKEDEELLHLS
jgi:CTD small phosphatase-like protein 2